MKEEGIQMEGEVVEAFPNAMFRIRLDATGAEVLATVCGKMRKFSIRVLPRDRVIVEMSPYDLTRGRILRRI